MNATIESLLGEATNREIDTCDSPIEIIQKFYKDDANGACRLFQTQREINQMMEGRVDEYRSIFLLLNGEGEPISVDWYVSLQDQPVIMEIITNLKRKGQSPVFVVNVPTMAA